MSDDLIKSPQGERKWSVSVGVHDSGFGSKPSLVSTRTAAAPSDTQDTSSATSRADRHNRVLLPFWTSGQARKQLKYMALEEERTQQKLLSEALNLLFQSRGKPPIA
jgi:hypothetical protein